MATAAAPLAGAETSTAAAQGSQPSGSAETSYDSIFGDTPGAQSGGTQDGGRPAGGEEAGGNSGDGKTQAAPGEKDPAAPAGSEEQLPWDKDERFIKYNNERKAFEAEKAQIDELRALVPSTEEARVLLERVKTADQATQRFETVQRGFQNDPIGLAKWWKSTHPQAWDTILSEIRPGVLEDLIDAAARSGDQEAAAALKSYAEKIAANPAGDQTRGGNTREQQLERQIQERDQREFQGKQEGFQKSVVTGYGTSLRQTFGELTKGIAFKSPEQQEHLFERVMSAVEKEAESDPAFTTRLEALIKSGKLDESHTAQVVKACINRAMFKGTFQRHVADMLKFHGLEREAAKANSDLDKAKNAAANRQEPGSTGAPAKPGGGKSNHERMHEAAKSGKDAYSALFDD